MDSARPIGVFNSGVGGLTVVRALLGRLPHENIVYFGDTARVPYGPKSTSVVREYAAQDTEVLLAHDVKLIVVACNTVSAVALDVVQQRSRVPVVGVIAPGAGAAVGASRSKRIGVIGTAGTIKSQAYLNAIHLLDPTVSVFGHACPLFVPLVEEGWIDHPATKIIAKEYLFPLLLEKVDTLVLGCTVLGRLERHDDASGARAAAERRRAGPVTIERRLGDHMAERSADWMPQADADLRHARNALKDGDHEWSAFAAQQAAEKAIKALYQVLHLDAWGHTLSVLLASLPEASRPDTRLVDVAKALDKHYIPTRYPNGFERGAPTDFYTHDEAALAIRHAEAILEYCRRQIGR